MSKGLFAVIAAFSVLSGWRTIAAEPSATKDVVVFADTSRTGKPFTKDPGVVSFGGRYLMGYSLPGMLGPGAQRWSVGIAESRDLTTWRKLAELPPGEGVESKGSTDGVTWRRLSQEPFLRSGPKGTWNSSESGHPGIFVEGNGDMHLFFQGDDTGGKTWSIGRHRIRWSGRMPSLVLDPVPAPADATPAK